MIQLPEGRRPPITPALALRVAVLGGVALALFAILFFRLWYLQVLSGDQYVAQARDNRVRDIKLQAPRGDIVDRNGSVLVDSESAVVVQLEIAELPEVERRLAARYGAQLAKAKRNERVAVPALPASERVVWRRYRRLGRVLGMSPQRIHRLVVQQLYLVPYANVTLKTDVPRTVYSYLRERQDDFPGVFVTPRYLRHYPHSQLAAHLFGTVGEVSPDELKEPRFRGVEQGTIVGKGGIERVYDRYLRGDDGATRVQVDSLGQPKGTLSVREPQKGQQLRLSLDLNLQRAGQQALNIGRRLANANGNPAPAGAFVAVDPRNGEVLAMGSEPTFNPNIFSKPVPVSVFNRLNSEEAGRPLYNRAIAGLYPTASTFKIVTAMTGLEEGLITPSTPVNDPGKIKIGDVTFRNAGDTANGTIALRRALQVSSDVFFYVIGRDANGLGPVLQKWARAFGLGRPTGIDLPGEFEGLIPTRQRRNRLFAKYQACRERGGEHYKCAVDNGFVDRPWSVGDNVNFSVGQGDVQATPLQMAVAYSALANGGKVVRPHLGLQVEDSAGRVLQRISPPPSRRIKFAAEHRQAIMDGLRLAAMEDGGTSSDVFKDFPHTVYGKTGTAERGLNVPDQSWYVAYVPHPRKPIVVSVTVEKGGFGAEAAAPAARLLLSEWFGVKKKIVRGSSKTR